MATTPHEESNIGIGEVNWLSHLCHSDERPEKVMRLDYAL